MDLTGVDLGKITFRLARNATPYNRIGVKRGYIAIAAPPARRGPRPLLFTLLYTPPGAHGQSQFKFTRKSSWLFPLLKTPEPNEHNIHSLPESRSSLDSRPYHVRELDQMRVRSSDLPERERVKETFC